MSKLTSVPGRMNLSSQPAILGTPMYVGSYGLQCPLATHAGSRV